MKYNTKKRKEKRYRLMLFSCIVAICYTAIGIAYQGLIFDLRAFAHDVTQVSYKAEKAHTEQSVASQRVSVEQQVRDIAYNHDFQWTDYLVRLARCESTLNPDATNHNGSYGTDRGLFQINDHYHSEVSDECSYDIECATEWTMWRIESGYQHEWMCNDLI